MQGPPDGARVAMDPGAERLIARPAAGLGPGVVEQSRQHPQVGRGEPGVGGDVVGEGGEGDRWVAPGRTSPCPVRGSAAGSGNLKVGEFTAAPPVPRRVTGPGTSGRRRRGPSAARRGVGRGRRARAGRSVGRASEEFSVMGSDRPLHWFVGRLEWRSKNPLPGEPGVDFASAGSLVGVQALANTYRDTSPRVVLDTRPWGSSH